MKVVPLLCFAQFYLVFPLTKTKYSYKKGKSVVLIDTIHTHL